MWSQPENEVLNRLHKQMPGNYLSYQGGQNKSSTGISAAQSQENINFGTKVKNYEAMQ